MANDREDLDMFHYDNWKRTGKKEHFQKLYRGYGGLIRSASDKAARGSNLPATAFKMQAAQQFYNSVDTYDPSKGASLKTHLFNGVHNKLKRINAQYGNWARIPERNKTGLGIFDINKYQNSIEILGQKLNREPTIVEVAADLNVTPEQVEGLKKEIRKDLSLNAQLEDLASFDEYASDKDLLQMMYYDMNPTQQLVYDYVAGEHGKEAILKPSGEVDYKAIGRKLRLPDSQVLKLRKQIQKMIKEYA